jgi:hypothetical protein
MHQSKKKVFHGIQVRKEVRRKVREETQEKTWEKTGSGPGLAPDGAAKVVADAAQHHVVAAAGVGVDIDLHLLLEHQESAV